MAPSLRRVFLVAERDLARFWRDKFWLAGQVAMNLADIAVFGLIFRGVVDPRYIPDYIKFIMPGVLGLSLFIAAFTIGREVGAELRREVTHYLASLPLKRSELVLGRIAGGVLRGLIYQSGFLLLAVAVMGAPSLVKWLFILYTSLTLSTLMSSLSITLSSLTRNLTLQATIRSLVYNLFFLVSNVFFPERVVAAILGFAAPLVTYSPLSMATNLYRWGFGYYASIDLVFNSLGLLAWTLAVLAVSYKLYTRSLLG